MLDSILYLWKSVGYAFDTVDLYKQRALRISGCRSDHEWHEQQSEAIETPFQIELADSLEAESRQSLKIKLKDSDYKMGPVRELT